MLLLVGDISDYLHLSVRLSGSRRHQNLQAGTFTPLSYIENALCHGIIHGYFSRQHYRKTWRHHAPYKAWPACNLVGPEKPCWLFLVTSCFTAPMRRMPQTIQFNISQVRWAKPESTFAFCISVTLLTGKRLAEVLCCSNRDLQKS